jgi:hypothetical protein
LRHATECGRPQFRDHAAAGFNAPQPTSKFDDLLREISYASMVL